MNREIKFRALRDDMGDCSFVYGCMIYSKDGHPRILTGRDERGWALFTTCLKGTEGQFTGLKDRNGVEIYEGDVLADGSEVKWSASGWWAVPVNLNRHPDRLFLLNIEAEVIGNIHENPELLK